MSTQQKAPSAANAQGSNDKSKSAIPNDTRPAACIQPAIVARFNAAVRAINAAEEQRPQPNAWGGLDFARRRGRLIISEPGVPSWDPNRGRTFEITTRPGWELWAEPGFSREGFRRNELQPADVLAIKQRGVV